MAKKVGNYFHFSQKELDTYIRDEGSCVKCLPNTMHIGFPPWGLDNFKDTLLSLITNKKVGHYDNDMNGIVLDVRNIKLEGTMSLIRYDSPELHLNIHADFYCFQPKVGALLRGTVMHISKKHVSVLIYNVFNVSIHLSGDFHKKLQVNREISFRVKKFDLQNVLPYIEGELLTNGGMDNGGDSGISSAKEKKFNPDDSSSDSDDSEDEKAFKKMVIKTEPKVATKAASSSSSSSSDSSEEEEKPRPAALVLKTESKKADAASSSDDDSSSSEDDTSAPANKLIAKRCVTPPMPIKIPVVKREHNSSSSSSFSSDDDDKLDKKKTATAPPPNKRVSFSKHLATSKDADFKLPSPIIKKEKSPKKGNKSVSSADSESDSTKPSVQSKVAKQNGTKQPREKKKANTITSDTSESEAEKSPKKSISSTTTPPPGSIVKLEATIDTVAKRIDHVSKVVRQSPKKEPQSDKEATPTPTKKRKAAAATKKNAPAVPSTDQDATLAQMKSLNLDPKILEKLIATYKQETTTATPSSPPVKDIKQETTPKKRKPAAKKVTPAKPVSAPAAANSSSDDDEDDDDDESFSSTLNLNNSIKNILSQVYTSKMTKAPPKVTSPKKGKRKTDIKDLEVSNFNATDFLSSTRVDCDSPAVKEAPAKKKKKKAKDDC